MTRWCTIALAGLALLGPTGCPKIEGGAVEVAWMVRNSSNRAVTCENAGIDRIRLRVSPEDEPSMDLCANIEPLSVCEFKCGDGGGASAFDIPEGTYFFDLVPLTNEGTAIPASEMVVPAPLRRTIVEGDIADLGIWQIVVL